MTFQGALCHSNKSVKLQTNFVKRKVEVFDGFFLLKRADQNPVLFFFYMELLVFQYKKFKLCRNLKVILTGVLKEHDTFRILFHVGMLN